MGRLRAETALAQDTPVRPPGRAENSHAPSVKQATKPGSAGGALSWLIPRQHGAWSILIVSYLTGVMAFEGRDGAIPGLVLASVLTGFVGQHAAATALRTRRPSAVAWAVALNGAAAGSVAVLLFVCDRRLLLPVVLAGAALALISLLVQHAHRDRTAWGELIGILGLSTAIPIASLSRTGEPGVAHLGLWLLGLLYFCGSVFHVRFLVRNWRARRGPLGARLRAGWASALYHPTALLAVAGLSALGWAPPWAAVALLPVTLKGLWALRRGGNAPPAIRRLGFIELAHSLLFASLVILTYHMAHGP